MQKKKSGGMYPLPFPKGIRSAYSKLKLLTLLMLNMTKRILNKLVVPAIWNLERVFLCCHKQQHKANIGGKAS